MNISYWLYKALEFGWDDGYFSIDIAITNAKKFAMSKPDYRSTSRTSYDEYTARARARNLASKLCEIRRHCEEM